MVCGTELVVERKHRFERHKHDRNSTNDANSDLEGSESQIRRANSLAP